MFRRLTALLLLTASLGGLVAAPASSARNPRTPRWGGADSPLRPGAAFTADGLDCTFNFVFFEPGTAATAPKAYIGTAAHCTKKVGQYVETPALGRVGRVVFDSDKSKDDEILSLDFSLIRIDPEVVGKTNPAVLGWEGPTRVVKTDELELGDRINIYGYGLVVGWVEQSRPRYGYLMSHDGKEYKANMPAVNGDSGGPLIHDETGAALGIVSRYGFSPPPSTDEGPLMPWIMRELHAAGFEVRLATP